MISWIMDQNKKGLTNNLTCDVCKIDFNSNADYALHEFSKKHCDNLIRLAKQKPVVNKSKTKTEKEPVVEKEPPKVTSAQRTGSFAKYGYFIPGEIYTNSETSREFNTDYDPYLQKFTENPLKGKVNAPTPTDSSAFLSVTSFSKKKKKKIKTCQVCNVTLATVPEYEGHMKSTQHIWKLKVTGMGVSAHFVKASSDLHTTDTGGPKTTVCQMEEKIPAKTTTNSKNISSGPFPLLYCSDCELLLNSPQQYSAHINDKTHLDCAQRKAELKAKREKTENPSPNQLYCYSCKISLNNLFQYNEHKNGKKHKSKCRNLVRKGITIPPEERVPGIPTPTPYRRLVYPELYEKLVLEKQKQKDVNSSVEMPNKGERSMSGAEVTSLVPSSTLTSTQAENNLDVQQNGENLRMDYSENSSDTERPTIDSDSCYCKIIHNNSTPAVVESDLNRSNSVSEVLGSQLDNEKSLDRTEANENKSKRQVTIVTGNTPVKCSFCNKSFQWQSQLDVHFGSEDHIRKILEHKLNGRSESDILTTLFSDRDVIKPNNLNKLVCSICNVTVENTLEFDRHINSIVHKYTQKDYRMKRTLEIKHILPSNEDGLYFCKLCREGWPSLVDYTQHLHFVKHKSIQRAMAKMAVLAKKRTALKPRFVQSLKKRNVSLRKVKTGKNPGMRTKVCGMAVDLNSGAQATIPNLEPFEPKIDVSRNVTIRECEKVIDSTNNNNEHEKPKSPTIKKRGKIMRSNRKSVPDQQRGGPYYDDIPPFMPPGNLIPPLMPGPSFQPLIPRPGYVAPNRNWVPFSAPHTPVYGPFCNRPYPRPTSSQRPPWPRYR